MEDFIVGNIVKGEVTGIEPYGIFVKIDDSHSGLIHISEITDNYVKNINSFVNVGDVIFAKIIDVDDDSSNLRLSIKGLNYKENNRTGNIRETVRGFSPLQENLPKWTDEALRSFE